MRGLDDARGIDTGRVLGTFQAEMIGPHPHPFAGNALAPHDHSYGPIQGRYGANSDPQTVFRPATGDSNGSSTSLTVTSVSAGTPSGTVGNNTGTENRPGNYADLVCIKL